MDSFAERFKTALIVREMRQSDISRITGIDKSLISNYLSGNYKAKQDNLYLIAKALNVSESWLMGYDVPMSRAPLDDGWSKSFKNRLSEEINMVDIDTTVDECQYTLDEAEQLLNDSSPLSFSAACHMADSFGFSIDEAVGLPNRTLSSKTQEFVNLFTQLTPEQQKMLILQMKGVLVNGNGRKNSKS